MLHNQTIYKPDQIQKINELQEALIVYERLNLKNEFLYALRLYTFLLITVGDTIKLKELMFDYKFLLNQEEEQILDTRP